jgi:sugar O-acyltransferase (sialic acid O-acetyltransferase NeuD family)
LIVGAGGHGKVVAEAAADSARWEHIAFLDEQQPLRTCVLRWEVIGRFAEAARFLATFPELVVGLGDNALRLRCLQRLQSAGFSLPAVVHPRAFVSASAVLGPGTVVLAQAAVNAEARIGAGGIVNTGATVDHDCLLGEGVHIAPGAHLAGGVKVGRHSWVGIGACIKQQLAIGADVTIGAGSVVLGDLPDNVTAAGVPARIIHRHG